MIEDADLANTPGPSTDIAAGGNSGPDREPAAAAAGPLAMSEDAFVPVAEYARSRGVSAQATRNAITSGRISGEAFTVDVRGHYLIRPLAADRQWNKHPVPGLPAPAPRSPEQTEAVRIRRQREAFALKREQFEFAERRRQYVSVADVRADAERIGAEAREAMLAIADRIAPRLAAESDPRACHALLTDEVRRVLNSLADSLAGVAPAPQ